MDKYHNLMVMGAGAVGGYFGGRVAERTSTEVTLIARGDHLHAIQKQGLLIKSEEKESRIAARALRHPKDAPDPDLVLFTVKSYDTEAAVEQIRPVVSENTRILTIQNGIENYPKLVRAFGEERVIQGFCKIGAGVPEPGVIEHKAFGKITIGEQDGSHTSRIEKTKTLFEEAKVPVRVSSEITREVWLKFSWNCLLNMVTAAGNVTVEKIFEHGESKQLCYHIYEELRKIAEDEGVKLSREAGKTIIEAAGDLTGFETSTYQDRQKGKKMEYEAFTGAVIRLAEKHSIEVPYNQTLYAILKLIDKDEKS